LGQVAAEAEVEDHQHDDGGDDRPGEFEGGAVPALVGRGGGADLVAIPDGEEDHQEEDQRREKDADPVDQVERPIHVPGVGGAAEGHPEGAGRTVNALGGGSVEELGYFVARLRQHGKKAVHHDWESEEVGCSTGNWPDGPVASRRLVRRTSVKRTPIITSTVTAPAPR